MKSYKMHGDIVLYLFDKVPVLMPGSHVSVLSVSCVIISVCELLSLIVLKWGNLNLVWFDCAYSCAHHNCVTDITCACLCCTCFYKCKKYSLSFLCCLVFCKLSEPSCKGLFWMWVTPQYLLGSRLMAETHRGYMLKCDSHQEQCIHSHAGATNLLFRSTLTACFSFAVGNPEARLKLGSLGHTCGLDVQFAKNIHLLFLIH